MKPKMWKNEELKTARVTQSEFGRLVGVTRSRVNQLVKSGLLVDDGHGLKLVESLKDYYLYRAVRRHYGATPAEYFQRFAWKYE